MEKIIKFYPYEEFRRNSCSKCFSDGLSKEDALSQR